MSEQIDQRSCDALMTNNLMTVRGLNNQFSIGVVAHSPKLREAIANGKLNDFLNAFGSLYRSIYGGEPWNEHLICANKECGEKMGIPLETDLQTIDQIFSAKPEEFSCQNCHSPMELFYPPEQIILNLRYGFSQAIFASLLFDPGKTLQGFSLGWETTVRDGYRDKMIIGTGDPQEPAMRYEEYREEFRRILGVEHNEDSKVFNSAEWAISREARGAGSSIALLHAIYCLAQQKMADAPEEQTPVIGHTLQDSKAQRIFEKVGFTAGTKIWLDAPDEDQKQVRVYSTLPRLIAGTRPKHR